MKASSLLTTSFIFLLLMTVSFAGFSQDKKNDKALQVKESVENQHYIFVAQTALPLQGRVRQLTTDYTLKVSKDTVIADLPYFGRAYSAPIGTSGGGIQFTSTKFEYTSTERKKGGWNISIKPKESQDVRELSLSISENGYASLQVISNNRQAISFNGYLKLK